jgi:hypothetical protein
MLSWATIRTGVATLLDTVTGVEPRATAKLGKADSVTATVIGGDPLIRPSAHQGKYEVRFIVRLKVAKAKLTESQDTIDAMIWPTGASSLIAAIYADSTIAGAVDDLVMQEVVNYEQTADSNQVQADINYLAMVTA